MKKKVLFFTILGVLTFSINIKAEEINFNYIDTESICNISTIENIGEIKRDNYININGVKTSLYCTFVDSDDAMLNLKEEYANFLEVIMTENNLDEINKNNWKEYRNFINDYNDYTSTYTNDKINIEKFFDIYENSYKNEEILDKYSIDYEDNITISSDNINNIYIYLPYYSVYESVNKTYLNKSISEVASTSSAISYAKTYAKSPNTSKYKYFKGSDCTNFVSQILEASGVSQVVYDSVYSGWWHKSSKNILGVTTHTHSHSWTLADTFSRYMGIGYKTTNHSSFSKNIKQGDYIALDKDSDGDWDHMGFVVETGNGLCTLDGKEYIDYRVAQHSTNYLEWVSSSANGWEDVEGDATYARVRR